MLYHSENTEEKNKKEKLLEALKEAYLKKEIHLEHFNAPYSRITKMSNDENLIDTLFENHINSFRNQYGLGNKIIHKNREKGIVAILNTTTFNSNYDSLKHQNIDFNNLHDSIYQLQTDFIQTKHLLDLINEHINNTIKEAQDNFTKGLIRQENDKEYILTVINEVSDALFRFSSNLTKAPNYDTQYYKLIIEKISEILKSLTLDYFDILPNKTKSKLKEHFPSLVSFLNNKNLIGSFKINSAYKYNLIVIKNRLEKNKLIEIVDKEHFIKIFREEFITYRINWISDKGLLFYFIKQLADKKYLLSNRDIWLKTAHCFTLNHQDIDSNELSRQKIPKNSNKLKLVDSLFKNSNY